MFSMSASSLSGLPHTIASLPRKCLVCDAPWDELHLSVMTQQEENWRNCKIHLEQT